MAPDHIPAWKRLGLKLKGPDANGDTKSASTISSSQQPNHVEVYTNGTTKHADLPHLVNVADGPENDLVGAQARKRKHQQDESVTPPAHKRRKSVTFAPEVKLPAEAAKKDLNETQDDAAVAGTHDQSAYLAYLQDFHSDRTAWKFNKNKQGLLLKHALNVDKVPLEHSEALGEYVQGLKGAQSRERLRTRALEISKQENDEDEAAARIALKDEALRDRLQQTRRRLREADREKARESDEFRKRLKKRLRAEEILLALASSEGSMPTSISIPIDESPTPRHIKFEETDSTAGSVGKQRGPRRQRVRTGVPDDDTSDSEDAIARTNGDATTSSDESDSSSETSSESSESDVVSSSDPSEGASSDDGSDDDEATGRQKGPRVDKQAVKMLMQKQNGTASQTPGTKPVKPKVGRKPRPFPVERFRR